MRVDHHSKWTRAHGLPEDRGTTDEEEPAMVTTAITTPHTPAVVATAARGVVTAARFLGHFLLALFGVAFLGTGLDH
ncbi:hypothetical protein [Umezawaea sp. Da 62-37]|uniref:hypothetical protein n=1 Tax=Umezawaea sp. Da 62-37 TaxID=3075927 RepID=UPI0028F7315C|nr:hypothetical protein [Umezawaea sp. Da 62-37]WNV84211.1 hypothetical protein RM788_39540 [Umezawaea sp. Da 62-37]